MRDIDLKNTKNKRKNSRLWVSDYLLSKQTVNYICLTCFESENIPLNIVRDFDRMDQGDGAVGTIHM